MEEELIWWYTNSSSNDDEDQKGSVFMRYLYEVDGNVVEMELNEADFYNDGFDE